MGSSRSKLAGQVAATAVGTCVLWWLIYWLITWLALPQVATDFYGGIPRDKVRALQNRAGVKVVTGGDWVHLGWVADPEVEKYHVLEWIDGDWRLLVRSRFGSALITGLTKRDDHRFRVVAVAARDSAWRDAAVALGLGAPTLQPRLLAEVKVRTGAAPPPFQRPRVAGKWRYLFRPEKTGDYINDHALFRDRAGAWRALGITGPGAGDYSRELWFAHGSTDSLDDGEMVETERVADYGEAAWAPHVIRTSGGRYHLYWSPHRAAHAVSYDGVVWQGREDAIRVPYNRFFRDPMVLEVAPGQWLMYATARGRYFSMVDVYQSFDLENWQYIRSAWRAAWGSERNAIVSSAESPFVIAKDGNYYLSITYNNESGIFAPIGLALGVWMGGAESYNDTLVFASTNPYDFGDYEGRESTSNLVAELEAHAPEYIHDESSGRWYLTTCGWPLAATLTRGELAIAPLSWERR